MVDFFSFVFDFLMSLFEDIGKGLKDIFSGFESLFSTLIILILFLFLIYAFGVIIYTIIAGIFITHYKKRTYFVSDLTYWCFLVYKIIFFIGSVTLLFDGEFSLALLLIILLSGIHSFQDKYTL